MDGTMGCAMADSVACCLSEPGEVFAGWLPAVAAPYGEEILLACAPRDGQGATLGTCWTFGANVV
jgi:hypothetical protein